MEIVVKAKILKSISLIFFIFFFINVLIGKMNVAFDWDVYHFGDVVEFLLLLVSSTSLIVVALELESNHKIDRGI